MLLTTYNPDSQTECPVCRCMVRCHLTGGNMYSYSRYLDFWHEECGAEWRYSLDKMTTKITRSPLSLSPTVEVSDRFRKDFNNYLKTRFVRTTN